VVLLEDIALRNGFLRLVADYQLELGFWRTLTPTQFEIEIWWQWGEFFGNCF
jgi:hypothetical protein